MNVGPVRDMIMGDPLSSADATWGADSRRGPPQIVAAVGSRRSGALVVLRRSLVPELLTNVPLPGQKPLKNSTLWG